MHSRRRCPGNCRVVDRRPSPSLRAQTLDEAAPGLFRHGVASGDPLADRVILWTRVTRRRRAGGRPSTSSGASPPTQPLTQSSPRARRAGHAERDFTVKVDAGGPRSRAGPTTTRSMPTARASPIGRTRDTSGRRGRARSASRWCAARTIRPAFSTSYRCVANRRDLDAVVHLGDYIYEFDNGSLRRRHWPAAHSGAAARGGHA